LKFQTEAKTLLLPKTFNMIVLGGFIKQHPIVKTDNVIAGLKKSLPERYHHMLPDNEKALMKGMEIVESVQEL